MKKIFALCLFTLFLFLPVKIDAFCDIIKNNAERVSIGKIAANINFSTFYEETENDLLFNIRISNLHQDISLYDEKTGYKIFYGLNSSNPNEYVLKNYQPGQTVQFNITAVNGECISDTEVISIKNISLPAYNKHYKNPLCKGLGEYLLCQKWSDINIDDDEFEERIVLLKKEIATDPEVKEPAASLYISLFELVNKYYPYLLGVIFVYWIIRIYRKRKDDFKL